ncbi:MAG TPA: transcriptional regulator [Croceibacterium sp.]|nr:transcriptional regulator [Croceibacterium sp.]
MTAARFRFDRFVLDPGNRRLALDGRPVELNARYLDALALLVREQGQLVSKDRFLDEVWRGVPVTDEALTQCIKTLRRQLGDDAGNPRFIETVPKHGYRFIAPVETADGAAAAGAEPGRASSAPWQQFLWLGFAGTLGGGIAGAIGGLFYGFAGASQPLAPGIGALSVLLVLFSVTALVALVGAAGVSFGIAGADYLSGRPGRWRVVGGVLGGLLIGAVVKLLGLDAFALLFGQSPGDITGAAEGAVLGAAVASGAWLADRARNASSLARVALAGVPGGVAGVLIPMLGGRMMAGSLDLLAQTFPGSRLRLDPIGRLFGEDGFGPVSHAVTGGLEGLLFTGGVVGAMLLARRRLTGER